MKHDHQRIHELFARYHEGRLSRREEEEFWGYVVDPSLEHLIKQLLSEEFTRETEPLVLDQQIQQRILKHIYQQDAPVIRMKRFNWLPYVAAAMLIALAGSWFLLHDQIEPQHQLVQLEGEHIHPGGNRAVLTLADGRKILLNADQSGIVLSDEQITYEDGNPLAGLDIKGQANGPVSWLELAIPRGGIYQVTLPDDTRVWLNAGSVLRYPSRFDREQRVVELTGEAFFDVAQLRDKNRKVPFLVKTNKQTVEVLGTQFNLSAYSDDVEEKTTLVEGSVRIASATDQYTPVMLKPGEQSIQNGGKVAIVAIDVQPFIAWKEGYFYFKSTSFTDVMKQMARWYDINLVYKGNTPKQTFSGKMSRNVSLQNVLKFFEGSGIRFTLVDNELIIEE